jgi:hypothetical protein
VKPKPALHKVVIKPKPIPQPVAPVEEPMSFAEQAPFYTLEAPSEEPKVKKISKDTLLAKLKAKKKVVPAKKKIVIKPLAHKKLSI